MKGDYARNAADVNAWDEKIKSLMIWHSEKFGHIGQAHITALFMAFLEHFRHTANQKQ